MFGDSDQSSCGASKDDGHAVGRPEVLVLEGKLGCALTRLGEVYVVEL
jgi:hypothetical protein